MTTRNETRQGVRLIFWLLLSIPSLFFVLMGIASVTYGGPEFGILLFGLIVFVVWTGIALVISFAAAVGIVISKSRSDA